MKALAHKSLSFSIWHKNMTLQSILYIIVSFRVEISRPFKLTFYAQMRNNTRHVPAQLTRIQDKAQSLYSISY